MYILQDMELIWQDEPIEYEVKDNEGIVKKTIPAIKKEHCTELIDGNCILTVDVDEVWDLENRPEPSDEVKMAAIRQERNRLLAECDFIISRHIEQLKLVGLDIMVNTVLTEQQYQVWLEYRQNLRDFPDSVNVSNPIYPTEPST